MDEEVLLRHWAERHARGISGWATSPSTSSPGEPWPSPVATSFAAVGRSALVIDDERDDSDEVCFGSTWVLVYGEPAKDRLAASLAAGSTPEIPPGFRPWSDRFSNLARVIKK